MTDTTQPPLVSRAVLVEAIAGALHPDVEDPYLSGDWQEAEDVLDAILPLVGPTSLARAWEEGLRAGKLHAVDAMRAGPMPPHPTNPYRTEGQPDA